MLCYLRLSLLSNVVVQRFLESAAVVDAVTFAHATARHFGDFRLAVFFKSPCIDAHFMRFESRISIARGVRTKLRMPMD